MSIYSDKLERIIKRAAAGNPVVEKVLREAAETEKVRARLEQVVREETTIEGAITKALTPGESPKATVAKLLAPAVAESFGNTRKGAPSKQRQEIEHGTVPRRF